uniref:Predicted protein n=1 Tax=Hordeum vulgare subsp. vulgare TaxID=112509 RepID=F2D4M0_HORVV|nr:predicted protein [Hordeum vulgare subsp. vulgare]
MGLLGCSNHSLSLHFLGFVELDKAIYRKISAIASAPRREIYFFSGFVVSILTGSSTEMILSYCSGHVYLYFPVMMSKK